MSEPTKEYGWRFLRDGEVIREGDQAWHMVPAIWDHLFNLMAGREFCSCPNCAPVRRRIDPGEGYEIVPAGTVEAENMQYTKDGGKTWVGNSFVRTYGTYKSVSSYGSIQAFRRRKTVQPQLVTFGVTPKRCLYWDDSYKMWLGTDHGGGPSYCYWIPMPPDPTPKPPEKSDAEKAWDSAVIKYPEGTATFRDAFIAGFNAAKKG